MPDRLEMNLLLDFYGELLTKKQQEICDLYYRQDLSLQEIAELMKISRAAVHDTLSRCRKELSHYEEILQMVKSSIHRREIYTKIKSISGQNVSELIDKCIETEIGGNYE